MTKEEYRCNYSRSKEGMIVEIYETQRSNSKKRGHTMPSYTVEELRDWILSQENFEELYQNWIDSDYNRWMKPSIDRKEDDKPYTISNIQLMIWQENSNKQHDYLRKGEKIVTSNPQKPVEQYDLKGNFIKEYHSINQAKRETGVHHSSISQACLGRYKTAGKFIWKYKERK